MAKTANIGPKGYDFGQGGYASFHRVQLPGMGTIPSSTASSADDPIVNFRKGILFYFGHLELPSVDVSTVKGVLSDIKTKVKDIDAAIKEGEKTDWGRNADVKTISEQVSESLQTIQGKAPAWLTEVSAQAASKISARTPAIVAGMISEVGNLGTPVVGNVKEFGKALVSAIKKTATYWSTRDLADALRSGEPKVIIESLRSELGKDALQKYGQALYEGATLVANVLTGGGASVVRKIIDTVAAFINYIWKLYKKIRDYLALEKFFSECKTKFTANDKVIFNTKKFQTWISDWMGELPIIAPHCMASPMCGSYYGFLSTLADEATLKGAYGKFESLKDPAREFVKNYYLEFTSSDPIVEMSLKVIQKGGIDLSDGAAAQSVSWFRKQAMKLGLAKNTIYS